MKTLLNSTQIALVGGAVATLNGEPININATLWESSMWRPDLGDGPEDNLCATMIFEAPNATQFIKISNFRAKDLIQRTNELLALNYTTTYFEGRSCNETSNVHRETFTPYNPIYY